MTRTLDLPDADARRAISDDLDVTLVVEAAAGTGKTTELVTRIVSVLAAGPTTMDQIVAVTFTEKAAGELKLRLRATLEEERARTADEKRRGRLRTALEKLEEAHVSTIHGFCAEILREHPVEARIDPMFAVLTEPQAERLFARAFRAWLQEALADPPEGVRRALRRTSGPAFGGLDDAGPIERLRGAAWALTSIRDFTRPWTRPPFDRERSIAALVDSLHQLAALSRAGSEKDNLFVSLDRVRRESAQIALEQSLDRHDVDAWEARLIDLARDQGLAKTRKGYGAKYGPYARADVLAARDAFYEALLTFREEADADLAALLQQELAEPALRYRDLKQRAGALDFVDLLTCARDLLRDHANVRRDLQDRFARIFVDEFQDTDPVQAEILLILSDRGSYPSTDIDPVPGKLFIVGDPKQAIYRFRGADVGTYRRVREQLMAKGARALELRTSFRSAPAILRFVNRAFAAEMRRDDMALQADYVALEERRLHDDAQPALIALPVPSPYSSGRFSNGVTGRAIEQSLPDAIGALVDWIIRESGWQIPERRSDGSDVRVPVDPRHIAVLFRRFTSFDEDVTRRYVAALEARGIAHVLVGGKSFHDREEVESIRAALTAVEWPDDQLSVFATLRGPLFAVDDEQLLEYRDRYGAFHPFRVPAALGGNSGTELALSGEDTAHLLPIADALRLLNRLHRRRNDRVVADTISDLLDATRAHVALMLRPGGEQALANVLHVAELARQYEAEGGLSFRGFIDELRRAAERTESPEAPIVEEGSDGVRLMTVHKAKGLEFPVVILADLTCRLNRDDPSRHLDASRRLCAMKIGGWAPRDLRDHANEEVARDRAEGIRLAYVAATRARDVLIVPAIGDEPWEAGWLSPLNGALYPAMADRPAAVRGPACPPLKSKDTTDVRPDDRPPDARTVAPGLHDYGEYSIVWWDPRWLTLGAEPTFGLRRQELIVKEVPREIVDRRRAAYDAWRAARDDARRRGAAPTWSVRTIRDLAAAADPLPGDEVRIVGLGAAGDRPYGPAFGALVHALLADVPFDADEALIARAGEQQGRMLGAARADIDAAARVTASALRHELIQRAALADREGRCRREAPVTMSTAEGVVEGIVDLAFEEHGRWIVVDYKTDRELASNGESTYRRQVAAYRVAIEDATGQPAEAILMRL